MSLRRLLPFLLLAFSIPAGAQAVNGVPSQVVSPTAAASSIFYIASACNGLSNCLQWVDDDSTDNCGSATTAFMGLINSYAGPGEAHVYISGSGSGKAYKLASCNLAFTGPSGTGGVAGSPSIQSFSTIDCAQTGGNCIQGGKAGCSIGLPPNFYGTGCHDFTWRGGTFVGGVGLATAVFEIEPGIAESIIDDVTFNNTGAGNATIGSCTNYSIEWDTFNGSPEASRNKYYGTVAGQCFSNNNDVTGGANTLIFANNTLLHSGGSSCGSQGHYDSSAHTIMQGNTIYGFSSAITLASNGTGSAGFLGDGGWMITGNNLDYSQGCTGSVNASIKFSGTVNNVGPATISNNNNQSSPMIAQASGATVSMLGWELVGNNTYVQNSFLIGGSSTACVLLYGVPCYLGANPGFPTTASGGGAYSGFTVLGANGSSATWPPSAAAPAFSPVAGAIAAGTVTTSCPGGGTPYISSGTAAVAGATGIAVSSPITLYGSCQGTGYFTTGSASYSISGSGFSFPNSQYLFNVATSLSSAALPAFTNSLTNGSLIVVTEYIAANTTFTAPTDTAGNTYTDCGPGTMHYNSGTDSTQCWYALNTHTTASNVVTIHSAAAGTYLSGAAFEILGAASSSPIDGGIGVGYSSNQNQIGGAAGLNNLTATSLTPAGNGDLILALFSSGYGGTAGTSPNTFTLVNSGWYNPSEYLTQATSASITPTASDSHGSDGYATITIAIKP